ncbi:hypothetical protein SAMN05444722_2948 [Rhodovulum sp. ES.010]|uniref:hypothetical protein n=1 Tax=Rhodovulum sp. ES.010 TaxID=1882821 RepID=UPI00092913B0|nr:hypothetical protein [Rhodovulum sp. ES.010]SIO51531.1 hypothetical protein SAMN05444722_2948 [Rhodovulum sp. ES.010]
MPLERKRPAKAGVAALAAVATAGFIGTVAPAVAERPAVQRPAVVGASVRLWLAPEARRLSAQSRQARKVQAARLDSRHGRGSYICSPSGFGERPRCFAR